MQETNKIKVAIAGAGEEGLETLSILNRDKTTSVLTLLDTDKDALGFRLGEYGYGYADNINLRLSHRIKDITNIQGLNFIVDTTTDRIHKDLYDLDIYPAEIINGYAARFIWELKCMEEIEKRRSFITDQINGLIEKINYGLQSVPQAHSIDEHSALLLRTSFLGTHAVSAQLTILEKNKPNKIIKDINIEHDLLIKRGVNRPYIKDWDESDKIIRYVVENKKSWEGLSGAVEGWDAVIVIPLIEESNVIGILWFFYTSSTSCFIKEDIVFISSNLQLFGRTISSTIESEDVRLTTIEKALSVEHLNIIGSEEPIGSKLKEVNSVLFKLLEAEDSHLYIKDPSTGDLVLQATTHKWSYPLGRVRIRNGEGVLGEVVERGNPLILKEANVNNIDGDYSIQRFAKREDAVTLLYIPLVVKNKGVGIISMEFTNIRNLNSDIYNSLVNLGGHLAITISSDVERYRMSQKIIKLSTVNEEGIELLSTTDLKKVLALSTALSAMLLDSAVSILRLSENGKLVVKSTYGTHEDKIDQTLLQIDSNISDMVSQTKIPALIHDVFEYEEITSDHDCSFKTAIAVPIFFNKELFGTLSLYNKTVYDALSSIFFTEDDREILEHFIQYVARGIINARHYNERLLLITIDEVTGLCNERYLAMRFPEEIKRAKRFNRYVSLIFFEVKPYDDNVIRDMATLINETFRNIDVLARLKDAKFAALLPDTGEGVKDAVSRLSAGFDKIREARPELTLYTGYSTYPDDSPDMHELIKKASKLRQH